MNYGVELYLDFLFAVAFIVALFRLVIGGDTEVFSAMMTSTFDMSKTGFEISLGLTGVLTLWMGIMKIGERGGAVQVMSGMINPFSAVFSLGCLRIVLPMGPL